VPASTLTVQAPPTAAPTRRTPALLPRIRAVRPPRWWQEAAFVALCYWLYSVVRNAVPDHQIGATHRAEAIMGIERTLHVDVEQSVNSFVTHTHWLAYVCNYYYATLHFVVTIGVLVWLYHRHPLRYRSIRSALFATNLFALAFFWLFALAPPRMFAGRGFVDTVTAFHTWGSYASGDLAKASNQYAAMPSLHIGWSLWCAIVVVGLAERRWVRILAALYPVATLFVVVGTANHYFADALGGVLVVVAGFAVQRVLTGRPAFAQPAVTRHPTELAAAA
jgi:hypothetical protein